jgi:alpha-D-xyloside xylohydrolase
VCSGTTRRLREPQAIPAHFTASYYAGGHFDNLVGQREDAAIDITPAAATTNDQIFAGLPPKGDVSIRWEGEVQPETSGDYTFHAYSNGNIKLWVDGQLVMDHWRQEWLPWIDIARVHLEAGKPSHIKLEWIKDQGAPTLQLRWKTPSAEKTTALWSEVGDGIDYYFIRGPRIDDIVAGYRTITGKAPMMPIWAMGLWQSRQRYETQQQSLDVVDGFRSRKIPFDNIVQDWFYWKADQWGSHEFDPARFPDPQGWINAIHDRHARLMISVWGKFYPATKNFEEMHNRAYLYELNLREGLHDWVKYPYTFYDAFNPGARALFWEQMNRELFAKHVDAWWMDASEPDVMPQPTLDCQRTHMHPTALGTGSRMLNAYPLVNAQGIYEGQRGAAPDQRVFNLTRSGFAGMQRYAAATWSGDITSTWTAMRKQISAGLGFGLSGMPWWTMDIGGFAVPRRFSSHTPRSEDADEWRELNTRWFEFGTFVPLLRSHGEFPYREMWQFGGDDSPAYHAMLKFDRLRYRLLPYIYSLAADVTHNDGTIMRALVMDFPDDERAREVNDQYLFGPALLVSPVTEYKARTRAVYLPHTAGGWYDFWTGAAMDGGQSPGVAAPYDVIPLHVRAGSIIPVGPELQYTTEKPADPITLYVYAAANGHFTLYEDDGTTYGYENGAAARIPVRWDNAKRTLTIGQRTGSFPGMLKEHTFNVVLINKTNAVGWDDATPAAIAVHYTGETVDVHLK